jgi:hypothetical protein
MNKDEIEALISRNSRMSYLLGFATGILLELVSSDAVPDPYRGRLRNVVDDITLEINSLYYSDHEK